MKLKGKVVAITGAAQGLGQALAQRCSEEGAQVVVGDMNLEGAQETARMLPDAIAMKLDVTDFADCEAFAAAAIEKYGRIDVLVSNAGIVISGAIGEFNPDTWKKVVDVNLCGFFNVAKAVAVSYTHLAGASSGTTGHKRCLLLRAGLFLRSGSMSVHSFRT